METELKEMLSSIKEIEETQLDESSEKHLSFTVKKEVFAFGVLCIKEIIEYGEVTRVPMTPSYIRGVTNLRGSVVPVIDLSARLGKPVSEITKRTCVVIVESKVEDQTIDIGVTIDAINEVFGVKDDEREPAPAFGAGIDSEYIKSMVKKNGQFITLLDMDKVLDIDSLADYSSSSFYRGVHGSNRKTEQHKPVLN